MFLSGGYHYNVELEMRVPDSDENQAAGMLMASLALLCHRPRPQPPVPLPPVSPAPASLLPVGEGEGEGEGRAAPAGGPGLGGALREAPSADLEQQLLLLASSARPLTLVYRSWVARLLRRMLLAAPAALGLALETQHLRTPLMEGFVESPECPLGLINLTLWSSKVRFGAIARARSPG